MSVSLLMHSVISVLRSCSLTVFLKNISPKKIFKNKQFCCQNTSSLKVHYCTVQTIGIKFSSQRLSSVPYPPLLTARQDACMHAQRDIVLANLSVCHIVILYLSERTLSLNSFHHLVWEWPIFSSTTVAMKFEGELPRQGFNTQR